MAEAKKGLVLLVHGSRDPEWMAPFEELCAAVASRLPSVRVTIACLQFCPPTVEQALSALAQEGINEVVVAPVFISALGHVLKDVPGQVEKARKKFPALKVTTREAVGELQVVKDAMRDGLVFLMK
jgi:sirohydrochlorin cobaltochelatase